MFSTIGKKTRVIFWNLCSMEKFLVAVAVALLFWGPDHSQVPNQDKILPCREAAITVSWGEGGGGARTGGWGPQTNLLWSNRAKAPETQPIKE